MSSKACRAQDEMKSMKGEITTMKGEITSMKGQLTQLREKGDGMEKLMLSRFDGVHRKFEGVDNKQKYPKYYCKTKNGNMQHPLNIGTQMMMIRRWGTYWNNSKTELRQ